MKEFTIRELRHYVYQWEQGKKTASNAYGILLCFGYFRRLTLTKEEWRVIREVEMTAKRDLPVLISLYAEFMEQSLLHLHAQEYAEEPQEETLSLFFQIRDEQQMVFELAQEYILEKKYRIDALEKIQTYLFNTDDMILWNRELVSNLQKWQPHQRPQGIDAEIFWWWGKSTESKDCWLPDYFRNFWLAAELSQKLTSLEKHKITMHLRQCEDCTLQYELTSVMSSSIEKKEGKIIRIPAPKLSALQKSTHRGRLAASSGISKNYEEESDGLIRWSYAREGSNLILRICSQDMSLVGRKIEISLGNIVKSAVFRVVQEGEVAAYLPDSKFPKIVFTLEEQQKVLNDIQIRY